MISIGIVDNEQGEKVPHGGRKSSLNDRLRKVLHNLDPVDRGTLENGTLVDDLETMVSSEIADSIIMDDERSLKNMDDIEWKEEESRPISELVLKKERKDKKTKR